MKTKTKMTKDIVPTDFTLSLAIVDAIPVLFFGINAIIIGIKINNLLFILGSILTFIAGFAKVLWKFIVVIKKKNVWILFIQMRILMPVGFILMILSIFIFYKESYKIFINNLFMTPNIIFIILGIIALILMIIFAFTLDNTKKKNNWIEQITNSIAHIMIFIGLII